MNKETQNIISKIINDVYEKNLNRRFWVNSLREILEENLKWLWESIIEKKCKQNHIRLNAMMSREEKEKMLWKEILRQLESWEHTIKEQIWNTWIYSTKLYVSINQS